MSTKIVPCDAVARGQHRVTAPDGSTLMAGPIGPVPPGRPVGRIELHPDDYARFRAWQERISHIR